MNARSVGKRALQVVLALAFVAVLLAFAGVFNGDQVEPGTRAAPPGLPTPAIIEEARLVELPVWYEAVGTLRSKTRVSVAPQVAGQIVALNAVVGDQVERGDELAILETAELEARVGQARSALAATSAARGQAAAYQQRIAALFEKRASTPETHDAAETELLRADAEVAAAKQRLAEAEIALARTRITSPLTGVVAERMAEVGDLAWPGQPLFIVHDERSLRLEANVREGLFGRVKSGEEVELHFPALELSLRGTVDEIVPRTDAISRSFLVKVSLPTNDGLVPGMFGRLRLPLGERQAVMVPEAAITRVGQLATVQVLQASQRGRWERRLVALGEARGELREVLSGLDGGEKLGWNE